MSENTGSSRLLFFLIFVGIFVAVAAGTSTQVVTQPSLNPAPPPANTLSTVMNWLPWVLLAGFAYWLIKRTVTQKEVKAYNAAVQKMNARNFQEALAGFEEVLPNVKNKYLYPIALWGKSCCQYKLGRPYEALETLGEAQAALKAAKTEKGDTAYIIHKELSEQWAVEGHPDAARRYLDLAVKSEPPAVQTPLTLAELMILCRENRLGEAIGLVEKEFSKVEGHYSGDQVRELKLFWAFALKSQPDSAETAAKLLAGLYPYKPGEFDYLAVNWPELKAFLIAHNLSAPHAAA